MDASDVQKLERHRLHGLISIPASPTSMFFSDLTDAECINNLNVSLKKFGNEHDKKNVNICKQILKQSNRQHIDNKTVDNYYELIKERDLRLIDEMNIKYAKIKLDT